MSNVFIKLQTTNDRNGHPRRMLVCIEPDENGGRVIGVGTIGYSGDGLTGRELDPAFIDYAIGIDVSAPEYSRFVKYFKGRGLLKVEG